MRAVVFAVLLLVVVPAGARQAWDADAIMAVGTPKVRLQASSGPEVIELGPVGLALGVLNRLGGVAGIRAKLYVVEGQQFQAFVGGGLPAGAIGITLGALTAMGDRADRMAMVLGHELAHVRLGHIAGARVRNGIIEVLGAVLGAAVEARTGVPIGGVTSGVAGRVAAAAFDRDQEREADALAIDWIRMAGYNAQGALDVLERLTGTGGWFSTHPSGADRAEAARRQIAEPPGAAVRRLTASSQ